ncbi:MAG: hypothetical protein ACLPQX_16595 [Syntrophobacteraceae bacterium]
MYQAHRSLAEPRRFLSLCLANRN